MAPQTPADEETPLLHAQQQKRVRTPLPLRQILILLLLQLAEPLTSQVISPFAPQAGLICCRWIAMPDLSLSAHTRYRCHAWRRNQGWVLRWHAGKSSTNSPGPSSDRAL